MASRISQMRNEMQPYPQTPQGQLNQSIEATRNLMQQVKSAQNPQAVLTQILQNNPNTAMIANALHNGTSLESLARSIAQQRGINIDELIRQLQGGM